MPHPPTPPFPSYILSYPRSGSHLARYFVELITKRKTLGCFQNPKDTPIFMRPGVRLLGDLSGSHPVARKAHEAREVHSVAERLMLVVRDPVDAFISHAVGRKGMKAMLEIHHESGTLRRVNKGVAEYMRILNLYTDFSGEKILIKYEDMISPDHHENSIRAIGCMYGADEDVIVSALDNYQDHLKDSLSGPLRPPASVDENGKSKFSRSEELKSTYPDAYKKLVGHISQVTNHKIMTECYELIH